MYQVVEKAVCTALICQHTFSDDLFYELCREISCVLSHIYIDIIVYCDKTRDKLLQITLPPDFVWIIFSRIRISGVCLKNDSDSMHMVVVGH
jgi:hypothetical protein